MKPGVLGFSWINENFGGQTGAFIVVGRRDTSENLVTSSKTIPVSVINLSQRLKAMPKGA